MGNHNTGRWVAFSEKLPPFSAAIDDPTDTSADYVLVTNNLNARDRMGRMSHVWYARPWLGNDGEWSAFTESDRKIMFLTHWYDPFDALSDSAPDLLSALEQVKSRMTVTCDADYELFHAVEKTIIKAKGL